MSNSVFHFRGVVVQEAIMEVAADDEAQARARLTDPKFCRVRLFPGSSFELDAEQRPVQSTGGGSLEELIETAAARLKESK